MNEQDTLVLYAKELKMPTIKENLNVYIEDATRERWSYSKFLCKLLEEEVLRRSENRKVQRIRKADFPQLKYLEELVVSELPEDGQAILPIVSTLDFIKEGRSIVMYGNPGTGKTHIAIGLGMKACLAGYTVFFTSIPRLLTSIREAKAERHYAHWKTSLNTMISLSVMSLVT